MSIGAAGPVRAVVAAHATLAEALVDAVGCITGQADCFRAVSNTGRGAAELEAAIAEALASTGARIVFTDLPAGSCCMAARRLAKHDPGLVVVTGANLATLLDFAMQDPVPDGGGTATDEAHRAAARAAAARGRATLALTGD